MVVCSGKEQALRLRLALLPPLRLCPISVQSIRLSAIATSFILLLGPDVTWANETPTLYRSERDIIELHPGALSPSELQSFERQISEHNPLDLTIAALDPTRVTPVSELSPVLPTDWVYVTLQALSDRYNIPVGFPDGTYRGDRALTRYEFAAAMLPVLEQLTEVIVSGQAELASTADLLILERLQEELGNTLDDTQNRMTRLEERAQVVERQAFSTTSVLDAEALLALADQYGGDQTANTVAQYRLWLDVVTSFSGRDALHTRLIASDGEAFGDSDQSSESVSEVEQTAEGTLIQNSRGDTDDGVELDWIGYKTSVGDRDNPPFHLYLSAKGGTHAHYLDSISPLGNGSSGNGAISVFGQTSPIYTIGGGTGVGGEWEFDADGRFTLAAGYFAEQAADPDQGLFDRDYVALTQLTIRPTPAIALGLTYAHGYHTPDNAIFDAGLGDGAIAGTGVANATHSQLDTPATTNSYGLQARVDLNYQVSLYGFGGHTDIQFIDQGDGDIWYYGVGVAVQDWLIPQTSGGLIIGSEPYLAGIDHRSLTVQNDTPLHVEAFYTLRFSDQISITPGVIWLTAPNQDHDNSDRVIATLRTTFRF